MAGNTVVRVAPSNADQLRAWDGEDGAFWTARADRIDEGVAAYQERFIAAAAIEASANVLDIGCGSGQATRDAARLASDGSVLGVDLSSEMLAFARERAAADGLGNVRFLQADAQVHPFPDEHFDVVLSRHGSMFFGDAPAAFANIARSLRPGGRLVLLTWQPPARQEWFMAFRTAFAAGRELPVPPSRGQSPFSLSEPEYVRELLSSAGFTDVRLGDLNEPMYFGRGVDDAAQFITAQFGGVLRGLDDEARARALEVLRAGLADHESDQGVRYASATWLIEARRG
jgi:ubiquinone/menaquinone biosynthesis C-methylase UbiE